MKKIKALLVGLALLATPLVSAGFCSKTTNCGYYCWAYSPVGDTYCTLEFGGRLAICVSYNADGSIRDRAETPLCP